MFYFYEEWVSVSSTLVRELMRRQNYEDAKKYLNSEVHEMLNNIYKEGNLNMAKDTLPVIDISDGINNFRGEHEFLSNFYNAVVNYNGITYLNNEAAFQAQKVLDDEAKLEFQNLTPNKAKRLGRKVQLRPDWENVKVDIMYEIVRAKFAQHPELQEKLIETNNTPLYEGNTWNDYFWGVCKGKGKNNLGQILMKVRSELLNKR